MEEGATTLGSKAGVKKKLVKKWTALWSELLKIIPEQSYKVKNTNYSYPYLREINRQF